MLFVLNPHRSKSCETLRLNSAYQDKHMSKGALLLQTMGRNK